MFHILHTSTVHKAAPLADEGNSAYCQYSGAHTEAEILQNSYQNLGTRISP